MPFPQRQPPSYSKSSTSGFRSLKRSLNKPKCGRIIMVYFTNSSAQSTTRSRFPPGISLEPPSAAPSSVNEVYAWGTDDWFGMVNIRIHLPRTRRLLTVLKDCEPPDTIANPKVRPCVGRTDPVLKGIQSIWFLKTAVKLPCCSGETQKCPSLQRLRSRSSCTFGWLCCWSSLTGKPQGS